MTGLRSKPFPNPSSPIPQLRQSRAHIPATVLRGESRVPLVEKQRQKWNDPDYAYSSQLAGTMGGDGDWAKESLAFGFLMENQYWQVMRIWSRAWLVTK